MELDKLMELENATRKGRREMFRLGFALLFLVGVILYIVMRGGEVSIPLVIAAMIGGYMALNIGANDVANNVGPAVGSKALTMGWAIVIAAVFEASGALIAGGDVVGTIKNGIINPALISDPQTFIWLMIAALLAGALWLNFATASGAPVSTTHSIVGGVLGAGVAAGGMDVVNWGQLSKIVASWVISPVLGGLIGALFLYWIKRTITYKPDMVAAAKRMVPLLQALMAWAFVTYLALKGLTQIWKVGFATAATLGLIAAIVTYLIVRSSVAKSAERMSNDKGSVNRLFTLPLIFSAALLSFAHGANDVANAVGPLAAINDAVAHGVVSAKSAIPLWVLCVGAIGIALGLALYGPKLIRTVGSEITELDQIRAFSVAMSAAVTVIIASQLALPVSSTHIAVGAIFGVGFLREYLKANYGHMISVIELHHEGHDREVVEAYIARFKAADFDEKGAMLKQLKQNPQAVAESGLTKGERKDLRGIYRTELVKRTAVGRIIAAWLITVPATALMAAFIYFAIRGMMLP